MKDDPDQYSPEETARRTESALRCAPSIPPKPQKELLSKSERAKTRKQSRVMKSGVIASKKNGPERRASVLEIMPLFVD